MSANRISMLLVFLTLLACDSGEAGRAAVRKVVDVHVPRMSAVIDDDIQRHKKGLTYAANRVAAGFVKAAPERIEQEMRQVLRLIRNPKKGVQELVISPMSFMAAVGIDGVVIARDAEADKMKGMNLAQRFEQVRSALSGTLALGIAEFENPIEGQPSSVTLLMAAPAMYQGKVVGALVLGIPLWRLSQRLSKQLQMESSKGGTILWVYVYRGDRLFHHGTSPDLDLLVPDAKARKAGLAKSPSGFTGVVAQYGFEYGYAVHPISQLGPDGGLIIFRMDPDI